MRRLTAMALLLLLVGCGGGSGGSKEDGDGEDVIPRGDPLVLTLSAAPSSYSFGFLPPNINVEFPVCPSNTTVVGDMDAQTDGAGVRAFLFFSLDGIPGGSTIDSATLRLYQEGRSGAPFADLGAVVVGRVTPYGDPCVNGGTIGGSSLLPGSAVLAAVSTPGWNECSLWSQVRTAWSEGGVALDLMLAHLLRDTDTDAFSDTVEYIGPSDPDIDKRPELVIEYYPPGT